jgi:hypothetical protein
MAEPGASRISTGKADNAAPGDILFSGVSSKLTS